MAWSWVRVNGWKTGGRHWHVARSIRHFNLFVHLMYSVAEINKRSDVQRDSLNHYALKHCPFHLGSCCSKLLLSGPLFLPLQHELKLMPPPSSSYEEYHSIPVSSCSINCWHFSWACNNNRSWQWHSHSRCNINSSTSSWFRSRNFMQTNHISFGALDTPAVCAASLQIDVHTVVLLLTKRILWTQTAVFWLLLTMRKSSLSA